MADPRVMAGDDDVVLEGLRRWDAVVLIALATRSGPPRSWPMRVYAVLRYRVRGRLRRLEQRGLVEPGWTVKLSRPRPALAKLTRRRRLAEGGVDIRAGLVVRAVDHDLDDEDRPCWLEVDATVGRDGERGWYATYEQEAMTWVPKHP